MQNIALHRFNEHNVPVTFKNSVTIKNSKLSVRCTIENEFSIARLDHEEYITAGMDIMGRIRDKQLELTTQLLYKYGLYDDVMI